MTVSGADRSGPDQLAPVGRTLAIARPASRRVVVATILGAGAIAADIGLLGTAAWLISKAAQHPNEATLAVAIVAVQFFGLSRGFLRYEERLVGHDAAFRLLADLRVRVYGRLERLAPSGLPSFRRGDLLARMVQDVDSLQDLVLRVVPPFGIALVVGVSTVVLLWWMLPAAALILAVALVLAATVVPWLTGWLARRREARFAAVRGDLGAAMVDLTEGAAELIAFGAADAHVRTIRNQDAELTAIASASAATAGVGLALTTLLAGLACWGCLVAGIPAVLSGRLGGTELAVITLIPLAAFELVVGLPVATQALQRVRQAAARVFEVLDAPGTRARSRDHRPATRRALRPGRAVGVGRLSGCRVSGSPWRGSLPAPRPARGRRGAERGGQIDPGLGAGRLSAVSGRLHHPVRRPDGAVIRRRAAHGGGTGRPGGLPVRHHRGRQPAGREARRHRRPAAPRARPGRLGRLARGATPGAGDRSGRRTGPACRGVSANAWPWPAPCWPTSRCSCWTSRPSTSSLRPPTRSRPMSWT